MQHKLLIPSEALRDCPGLGAQRNKGFDAIAYARIVGPRYGTWLITEADGSSFYGWCEFLPGFGQIAPFELSWLQTYDDVLRQLGFHSSGLMVDAYFRPEPLYRIVSPEHANSSSRRELMYRRSTLAHAGRREICA